MKITRTNVAVVVFDENGKVLLCKRADYKKIAPGKWHLPGGKIDDGETAGNGSQILCISNEGKRFTKITKHIMVYWP